MCGGSCLRINDRCLQTVVASSPSSLSTVCSVVHRVKMLIDDLIDSDIDHRESEIIVDE